MGARDAARLLPRRPLAQADRLLRRDDGAGGRAGRGAAGGVPPAVEARAGGRLGARSRSRSTTTSTPPPRSRVLHEWRDHELLVRALGALRARLARRARAGAARGRRAGRSAAIAARAARDFELADRLRAEIEAAGWEMRDEPGGYTLVRAPVSADLVYGRRAVREALRGRREVLELLATERAVAARGLARRGRAQARRERELSELAGDARPPGRRRAGRAVPLRGRLRARRGRAAAARGARPCHRSAQPRRGLPQRRGRRRDRRRRARARRRPSSRRRSPAPRPVRSSICRSRSSRTSPATSRR